MANPYEDITARIVAQLQQGVRPWAKGWVSGSGGSGRPRRANGVPYRGINALWLRMAALERGFASPYWVTFKGALALGGAVRKGARSEPAFYAGSTTKVRDGDNGQAEEHRIRFLKSYRVFNTEECDGLPSHLTPTVTTPRVNDGAPIAEAEAFIAATQAQIRPSGNLAAYMPGLDLILLPPFAQFHSPSAYYGTAFHELTHWTGAPHRLDRTLSQEKVEYAREELIAEIASAFLALDLNIDPTVRDDHASYIAHWIRWLEHDSRAIFTAAAQAEKAAGFLHTLQPGYVAPVEEKEAA